MNDSALTSDTPIFVAGHRGMVGSAMTRCLSAAGFKTIVTRTRQELDLTDQSAVRRFFKATQIDHVVLAAARVGGIYANSTFPAEFIYQNLMIQANVIQAAYQSGIRRLLFLGSSCIYPKHADQPMTETALLTGVLEPTNEPYAVAKIAGIKLCEAFNRQYGTDYRAVMPTNLYGPNDNFDLLNSHVLPAMIRKFYLAGLAAEGKQAAIDADETRFGAIPQDIRADLQTIFQARSDASDQAAGVVRLWGSGKPRREFLHVDDLAGACLKIMQLSRDDYADICAVPETDSAVSFINIGTGEDLTIKDLAHIVSAAAGFRGQIIWDRNRPDGTPRKLLDIRRLKKAGWTPSVSLEAGIQSVYNWYRNQSEGKAGRPD